jgi:VCBS repeat-containing protein
MVVTGQVSLAGELQVSASPDLPAGPGTIFTIIDNQSQTPVAGIFNGLPEGAALSVDGWTFRITYQGGDPIEGGSKGNDVQLILVSNDYSYLRAQNDSYVTPMNQTLNVAASGVLANDSNPGTGSMAAVVDSQATNGTLNLNSDGSFTYIPNASFTGVDTFTYHETNGAMNSNTATVSIDVVAPPVATDSDFATPENQPLTVPSPGLLAGVIGSGNLPLIATIDSFPLNGTLSQNPDGSYTYTPNSGFIGSDSFTYHASDGTNNSNEATVTITVYGPPQAMDDSFSTVQNQQLTVAAPGLIGDVVYNGNQNLSVSLASQPANGSVSLNADGSFNYTPNAGFVGSDSFTYVATDGTFTSNVATVSISVQNETPSASNQFYSAWAGQTLSVSASSGLLTNASSPTNAPLTAVVASQPSSGSLSVNADGSFTYTPAAGFTGMVTFTYYVTDGTNNSNIATVTLDIQAQFGGG